MVDDVLARTAADPRTSTRKLARTMQVNHMLVHRILRDNRIHPYHFTKTLTQLPGDSERRLQFCYDLIEHIDRNPLFLRRIVWTDECTFTRDGVFNMHNYHYYSDVNPHLSWNNKAQHKFKLNVWAGLIDNELVSAHKFLLFQFYSAMGASL